jgi:hypothetical protein
MRPYFFLLTFLFSGSLAWAEGNKIKFVPAGRLFPLTFADPREIRTSVAFAGDRYIQATVGSYLSLFSIEPEDGSWGFHFGLEGRGLFTLRQESGRFPLETVDGTIGVYAEYGKGNWQTQLRYTHVSAHFADGIVATPIPYSRETLSLRGGYSTAEGQAYVGIHRVANTVPAVHPLALQVGGSYFWPTDSALSPFVAADLRWQEETPINPSFALQIGVALHPPGKYTRSFRVYYSYYTGADIRGQYYLSTQTVHAIGIELPLDAL